MESFKKELTLVIIQELKKEIREETQELMKNQENKIVKLESTISMLQNHVNVLKQQSAENVKRSEELEQYGRRLCLRFDGIPTVKNEKASVLVNIKNKWEENELIQKKWEDEGLTMPDTVIDRAHRIGRPYVDREKNVECQSVIMRLTFRHRTQLYNARKLMENISVKLDLTKHRYQILKEARRIIERIDEVEYVYADINFRLKVKMGDDIIPYERSLNFFECQEKLIF